MIDTLSIDGSSAEYGIWTDHRIPENRSGWHRAVREFYEYWLSIAPPGRLPGRQHVVPEDIAPLLARVWLADVHRNPLRFRFRLAGTAVARSFCREVTGQWLDEAQPAILQNTVMNERFRFVAETGRPTWRRGPTNWERDPKHHNVENCLAPLAKDGTTVDMIFAVSVLFDCHGNEIKI